MPSPELCPTCGRPIHREKTSPENRLFHSLCASLAMWKQIDAETMKLYVKRYASAVHGYDCTMATIDGHKIINPKSVARATNQDMIERLIPSCYELGMDWGCPLEQPGSQD